ncbi:MAG: hypothetical protein IKX51_05200 [Bacteroidales bacterium]|nr:hypothetical protein [Bacteroidales bacterium]
MTGILIDNNCELAVRDGLLALGNTAEQNAALILTTGKGDWKENPALGASIIQYLHSQASDITIERQIRLQLKLDNISPKTLKVEDGAITLEV